MREPSSESSALTMGPRCPAVTAAQMREVDRIMIEDIGIDLVRMMENAGRGLAELAIRRFDPNRVVVLAGSGGNGGGGLVAARHLANRGRDVRVVLAKDPVVLTGVPAQQHTILRRMGVHVISLPDDGDPAEVSAMAEGVDLIIDALLGYSLVGDPRGPTAMLIDWANRHQAPVLALDTPSGLDVTSGRVGHPCIRAVATLTLALPKRGLLGAAPVGDLWLADISVPAVVYRSMGIEIADIFHRSGLVSLDDEGCVHSV